jgi:hypothetical protein
MKSLKNHVILYDDDSHDLMRLEKKNAHARAEVRTLPAA